ncbi:MAG: TonB-dependent receptor [Bacteroidales bacterium]|nr:TonB-dependent receptor [Bacteroidales bacterium]
MKSTKLLLFLLSGLFALNAGAQNLTVKGKVTDGSNGDPVPFATVVVKGATTWTTTNIDGEYTVEAPSNGTLSVESLGYVAAEVSVGGRSEVDVVLQPDFDQLSEAVVIGYGVQQKKLVTGSTIQVKGDDLAKLSTTSALNALQSQSPGVSITQNSGQPGRGYKVNIRGIGTIGDSEPLYVIDGVAGGDINTLNPNDIESIDILKDAASAAIYGARAANGVVLVTTKQGKEGRMVLSYDGYVGAQYIAKMPDMVDAKEYMQLYNLARENSGVTTVDFASVLPSNLYQSIMNGSWKGTNWVEEMYNKGARTENHSMNIAGGSPENRISMGLSYTRQDGILGWNEIEPMNAKYKRYTFRINSDNVVIKRHNLDVLKLGETLNFSYGENSGIGEGDIYESSLHDAIGATPLLPVYAKDAQGNITGFYDEEARAADGWNFFSDSKHPIGLDYYNRGRNLEKFYSMHASVYAELQPIRNLKFKTQFGYRMSASSNRSYKMIYHLNASQYNDQDQVTQKLKLNHRYTWENTVSYHFDINSDHVFDTVLGQSIEKWGFGESVSASAKNSIFPNDFTRAWLSNTKPALLNEISASGSPASQGALASFFGRVNYSFRDTYLFSATVRADGSSNFARGHRWGVFPSVSAGWIISNEPFMAGTSDWLSFLKLRASWGQNGNASIDNFQYLTTISLSSSAGYYFANKGALTTGAKPGVLANPDVSWETSEQTNLGLDARFFNSTLGVTIDGYIKDTKDWLVQAPIAGVYGFSAPYVNGGDVRNSGVEVSIDYGKHTGEFTYGVKLNGAYNKNIVTRIANAEGIIHGEDDVLSQGTSEMYRAQVGYPIGYFYGYKTAGVFQNQAEVDRTSAKYEDAKPGDLIFVDTDGDGKITEEDRTMIGNPHPDFTAGLNLWMAWKGFDLSVTGYGAFGQQIAKSYRSFFDRPTDSYTRDLLNCWSGEGTSNRLPLWTTCADRNWSNISDIYIENGDFFKVSNVTFGYDFSRLMRSNLISKARLYFSAQNLLTITKYSGMDPEIGYGFDEDWVSGIDLGYYPSARTFLVGVNIQF